MEALWNVLGGEDARAAQQAAWKLAAGGPLTVSFLGGLCHCPGPQAPGNRGIARPRLKDPDYDVREIAARTVLDLGISLSPDQRELLRRPAPPVEYQLAFPRR